MRFKKPVRGVCIGCCVDGSKIPADIAAHAHTAGAYVGFICAPTRKDLVEHLIHEMAHLASDSGHDDSWRKSVRKLGGRVPAAYRKKPRRKD